MCHSYICVLAFQAAESEGKEAVQGSVVSLSRPEGLQREKETWYS